MGCKTQLLPLNTVKQEGKLKPEALLGNLSAETASTPTLQEAPQLCCGSTNQNQAGDIKKHLHW